MMANVYPAWLNGERIGEIEVGEDGLYKTIKCTCMVKDDAIMRLFCESNGERIPIGVLAPSGTAQVLQKRFSKNEWTHLGIAEPMEWRLYRADAKPETAASAAPETYPATSAADFGAWQPADDLSGVFADDGLADLCRNIRDAQIRRDGGLLLLAVPHLPDAPFPLMPIFCFGTPEMIDGRNYIVFSVKDGLLAV